MPSLNHEAGTQVVVNRKTLATKFNWEDLGNSAVFRLGTLVIVALHAKKASYEAYSAEAEYEKGDIVTEGGDFYESLVDENEGHKPSTSPTQWKKLATAAEANEICTLPPDFRPAAAATDYQESVEVATSGAVTSGESAVMGAVVVYPAALVSP